jgi:ferredoxin-NADP reductase
VCFLLQEDGSSKPLVLIAGGIGITPVISILEHIVQNKIPRHVTVFASVRSSKLEPYSEALKEIAVSNLNVDLNLVYDDPPQAWNTKGPLTIDHVKTGLTTKVCYDIQRNRLLLLEQYSSMSVCVEYGFLAIARSYPCVPPIPN